MAGEAEGKINNEQQASGHAIAINGNRKPKTELPDPRWDAIKWQGLSVWVCVGKASQHAVSQKYTGRNTVYHGKALPT